MDIPFTYRALCDRTFLDCVHKILFLGLDFKLDDIHAHPMALNNVKLKVCNLCWIFVEW